MREWRRWWPFAVLCVAASCEWMLTDRFPRAGSTLGSEAVGCGLGAVGFGVAAGLRRRVWRTNLWAVAGGAMVICGPVVELFFGTRVVEPGTLAMALALTAVVVAVASGSGAGEVNDLWPGLAGVAGLLLVLSPPGFGSLGADAVMVLAPVVTGVGCVLFRRGVEAEGVAGCEWAMALGLAGAGLVFGVGAVVRGVVERVWPVVSGVAVGIDLVLAGLAVIALARVTALHYSARFVVVPLLILLQGLVFLGSAPSWRSVGCAALLGVATWGLVRRQSEGWVGINGGTAAEETRGAGG